MTYHLLDHVNAHNARELARTDLDARALGTLEWVPPTGLIERRDLYRERNGRYTDRGHTAFIGRGNRISCGDHILENAVANDPAASAYNSRYGMNVCRPFDEAHMIEAAAPHTPHDLHDDSEPDESALPLCYEVDGAGGKFAHFRDTGEAMPKRHTPPNHGHGARCLCFFYAPNWDLSLVDPEIQGRRRMTAMVLSSGQRVIVHSASTGLVSPQDCEWCAGTGRIICDDERAGRVSPSHAAGGYAEWQRRVGAMRWGSNVSDDYSITINDGRYSVRPNQAFSRNR